MQADIIGKHTTLIKFTDTNSPFWLPTYVLVITTNERVLFCDTHTGPKSIEYIMQHMYLFPKNYYAFLSHSDWDHTWGASYFSPDHIICHEICQQNLKNLALWKHNLDRFQEFANGNIQPVIPLVTFAGEMSYPEEGLHFFHTPGHTPCSASLWFEKDGILYVGDNIELPIPALWWHNLDAYEDTLLTYKHIAPRKIICGHSGEVSLHDLELNLKYIRAVRDGKDVSEFTTSYDTSRIHHFNLRSLVFSRYEELGRRILGEAFSYKEFLSVLDNPQITSTDLLEKALEQIINKQLAKS